MHGYTPKIRSASIYHNPPNETISMCIVPVRISHRNNEAHEFIAYALLDENSQGVFVHEGILNKLPAASKRQTCITTETINGQYTDTSFAVEGLIVKPIKEIESSYGPAKIELPTSYSRETLSFSGEEVPTVDKISNWKHLQPIINKLPAYDSTLLLGIIIGANCPKALEPQEVISSADNGPYASRSLLGWRVIGPISTPNVNNNVACYRIGVKIAMVDSSTETPSRHHLTLSSKVNDVSITQRLEDMYQLDFPEENAEKIALSNEDERFLRIMKSSVSKVAGHYQLPLPFRSENPFMPNNRVLALKRLMTTQRKMQKDERYRIDYVNFMNTLLEKGYAVQSDECPNGKTWYIPHHGVKQPTKQKLRVVFDCSASYRNHCLNEELLQGPVLTNMLVGVLLRFRHERIGFMGDIEAMFHQVRIPPEHQTFLKFLWWPNGDLSKPPKNYQMCVHIFGAVSSPSCANFALRQTVVDGSGHDPEARKTILNNFYVDDMLKSEANTKAAIKTISSVQELCSLGGFNLTKFVCGHKDVANSIPISNRSVDVIRELSKTESIERALGVHWCLNTDTLGFRITLQDSPLTRRGILATISSIYDPLGIAGPFLLKGRKILQAITSLKDGWDNQVPEELSAEWLKWRTQLPRLQEIAIPRCYKPDEFGPVRQSSLHMFSDASDVGYGVAGYLRQINSEGTVNVSLVFGKSRVTPAKPVTIPRLELTAAFVSVKVSAMLKDELMVPNMRDCYWTDSKISLGYITNDVRRFRVFVANRSQKIRAYTSKDQWHYVNTHENPADHASRGLTMDNADGIKQWLQGPQFLWKPEIDSPALDCSILVSDDDPEIKSSLAPQLHVQAAKLEESSHILTRVECISSWNKITRVMATVMEFCARIQKNKDRSSDFTLSVSSLRNAEIAVIRLIQEKYLQREIDFYGSKNRQQKATNKKRRREGNLWRLDPFVDEDKLLRVGGRLKKSNLPNSLKHPIILPNKCILTRRIAEHYHHKVKHGGRTSTINSIRQYGYWIVSVNTMVRSIIHSCFSCRAMRGKLGDQKMSELPEERFLTEGPFTYSGMDMFGPFYVKEGRKQHKRFVALFTCLSSRAIHLESTSCMETDSFIQALRRFLARRGPVSEIISDNGKNFVGAENELRREYKAMDHTKISEFLLSESCDWISWKKNPPSASHMGGIWERQIRSVRSVLTALLMEHSSALSDESFRTLLAEAECIVNSRPLTVDNLDDPHSLPISPSNILTMKTKVVLPPPGEFQRSDLYCRKRWRQVQHLANEFWSRWRKEFLQNLQTRSKWTKRKRNFEINDVVLIKDEDLPRNQWPLARITKIFRDEKDGLVRKVQLYAPTYKSELMRPIHKLVLLVEGDAQN